MSESPRCETRQLNLTVPAPIHSRLSRAAANRGTSMTDLLSRTVAGLNPDYRPVALPSISERKVVRNKFTIADQRLILQEKMYGGLSIYKIAELWRCNKSTVARIVNREAGYTQKIKVKEVPVSVADCEEIRGLVIDEQWSYRRTGARYGVSGTTAYRIYKKLGVYERYGQPK